MHLVDVMEARINQKTVQKTEPKSVLNSSSNTKSKIARRMKSTGPAVKSGHDAGEPDLAAMEAWRRRKNYDPMAAAGKKKEVTRKHSGTSLTSGASKTGREAHTVGETGFSSSAAAAAAAAAVPSNKKLQPGSAPNSAVSRSSDSSGYLSRTDTSRQSGRGKATSTGGSRPAPLRKLVHTGSSSSLKMQASRSSSSLTSKEAEFQAWKRRKNYDPMKAAGRKSSSPATANTNRGTGGAQTKGVYGASATEGKLAPQHHRVRDMSQSLVMGGESNYPIHRSRSSSFHYPGKKTGGTQQTSEEDSGEDYGSGSSAAEGGRHRNHFYLDDDELILPIGRTHGSQARLQDRSLYGSTSLSPQISPSKSRSKQLEALDNLVISTIYNVSSKLCVASSNVLRKAITVLPEQEEEQASTVETVLYLLDDVDLPTTPAKKTSRELSGTLRNLKKVEQAIEMLNKVLEIEEEQ